MSALVTLGKPRWANSVAATARMPSRRLGPGVSGTRDESGTWSRSDTGRVRTTAAQAATSRSDSSERGSVREWKPRLVNVVDTPQALSSAWAGLSTGNSAAMLAWIAARMSLIRCLTRRRSSELR
jgi:hypothetical protein